MCILLFPVSLHQLFDFIYSYIDPLYFILRFLVCKGFSSVSVQNNSFTCSIITHKHCKNLDTDEKILKILAIIKYIFLCREQNKIKKDLIDLIYLPESACLKLFPPRSVIINLA